MSLDRRRFLQGLGAGTLAALAGCKTTGVAATVTSKLPAYAEVGDAAFWSAVRAQYILDPELTYLNTGGLGPAPKPVLDVYTRTMLEQQRQGAHGHELFQAARETVARSFGVAPAEIAFARNATEGNSTIAAGLKLGPGDEVIFESHAHPGGAFPWYNQTNVRGVVVKLFEPDTESIEGNVARIRALITPRTKVIQISHVTAPTGIVLPAAEIGRLAHAHGIWFHIDGAQSAGMFPFGLRDLECDSYATSGHKWMGGPHETGVLFIRKERLGEVMPSETGSHSGILDQLPGDLKYVPTAQRHEAGTRNAASVVSLAAAVEFYDQIGPGRIAAHGRDLAVFLADELSRMPGITVLTPRRPELRASITSFRSDRVPYDDLFGRLWGDHHFRCRPVSEQHLDCVRVSTHLFNTADDCVRLLEAIRQVTRQA